MEGKECAQGYGQSLVADRSVHTAHRFTLKLLNLFSSPSNPVVLDLFSGLWGWSEGFIAAGWNAIGFDLKHPCTIPDNALFCRRDVLTLDRAWLKELSQAYNIRAIVASPPCQEFSYMSMPWSRAKQIEAALRGKGEFPANYNGGSRTIEQLTQLFRECFRIQRDICEITGRLVPMVVENVVGAQKWVGKAVSHFGSYYIWGDVPALLPVAVATENKHGPSPGRVWSERPPCVSAHREGIKVGRASERRWEDRPVARLRDALKHESAGIKGSRNVWSNGAGNLSAATSSHSQARVDASAAIAKIPFSLSSYIASTLLPRN